MDRSARGRERRGVSSLFLSEELDPLASGTGFGRVRNLAGYQGDVSHDTSPCDLVGSLSTVVPVCALLPNPLAQLWFILIAYFSPPFFSFPGSFSYSYLCPSGEVRKRSEDEMNWANGAPMLLQMSVQRHVSDRSGIWG